MNATKRIDTVRNLECEILRVYRKGFEEHKTFADLLDETSRVMDRCINWSKLPVCDQFRIMAYRDGVRNAFETRLVWCVNHNGKWQETSTIDIRETVSYSRSSFADCHKTSNGEYIPYNVELAN